MASNRPDAFKKRNDLVQSFDALALSGRKRDPSPQAIDKQPRPRVPSKDGAFVGGFSPAMNLAGDGSAYAPPNGWKPTAFRPASDNNGPSRPLYGGMPSPGPLPRPPAFISMPVSDTQQQQSLTMQHALGTPPRPGLIPYSPQTPPSRPHSASVLPPPSYPSSSKNPSPSPPKPGVNVTPKRPRASSEPLSPSTTPSKSGTVQCSGVTKAGKQCTRQVKSGSALSTVNPDAQMERFCHQHSKELLGVAGFYSHKVTNEYINFQDWIPDYLQPDTQVALRVEMEKPRSQADVPGYIYTFEIRDPNTPTKVHLKVGRAVNLVKRIDQWGKQCGSKEQILRGWWPGTVEDDDGDAAANGSLMKGRVKAGDKGPLCHRLERLVHLELADLAVNAPYLDPGFLKAKKKDVGDGNGSGNGTSTPSKKPPGSPAAKRALNKPCPDCGAVHKEIFSLTRVERGRYKGNEWDLLVKPVIEKWGGFVSAYV